MKHLILFALSFGLLTVALAQDSEFHLDEEYPMDKSGTIDLRVSDARVFVTGSSRSTAHVKIDRTVTMKGLYSSEEEFRVDVDPVNGGLVIREHQNTTTSGIITYLKENYKVEIAAPEGASLVIRGDDGDFFIKNVNGQLSLSVDDAAVQTTGCGGDKFSFRIDDGDLRMDGGRGELALEADDADIEIYAAAFLSVDVQIDDGDMVLETSLSDAGSYEVETEDGDVDLRVTAGGGIFSISHDDAGIRLHGPFETKDSEDNFSRVVLPGGNANVRIRADDAVVHLSHGDDR